MSIVGIDSITYGVEDLELCRRFFLDWGLRETSAGNFETLNGCEVKLRRSDDPVKRAAALNFYAPRSGDLIIVPERNWLLSTAATTHGTLYPYDQRVPVIFFGAGVKPGVYDTPATPADIAPTLAALAGAPFAATDGVALLR